MLNDLSGFCHCGCGSITDIAKRGYRKRGIRKGEHWKFVHGHHRRIRPVIERASPFKIRGVYCRLIPLSQDLWAIVDEVDYEWLMQWKWCAEKRPGGGYYAVRNEQVGMQNGKQKMRSIKMHRAVAERAGKRLPLSTDHWDRIGLNNTRDNLRPCNQTQNNANGKKRAGTKCRFKGASICAKTHQFIARIQVNSQQIWLGYHASEELAARAYDRAAIQHFGQFANVNFPTERTA